MRRRRGVPGPVLAFPFVALALAAPRTHAQSLPTSEACVDCHLTLEDDRLAEPARVFETDLHFELGFGCLDCHGDQGEGMLERSAGFLSAPDRRSIPGMCGGCHSDGAFMRQFDPSARIDQEAEYWTSGHGRALAESNDPDVATCTDCHQVHRMLRPSNSESSVYPTNVPATCGACHSDPQVMAGHDLPTDQAEKYRTSVHGLLLFEEGDVSSPVCNDCHGNHGAAPPGIGSVRNVCGQCHAVMADFFAESGHVELFEENDLPGCAACHEHHAIERVDETDLDARTAELCLDCHQTTDPAGRAFQRMRIVLDSLNEAAEWSRSLLEEAHNRGMEVSNALFELEDVGNAYTRAKSAIHTFSVEPVQREAQAGFQVAAVAEHNGMDALDEWQFRRVGLAVSAGIIFLLIAALLLRIREMDERMESILGSLSGFFEARMKPGVGGVSAEEMRLAAAALLVEAAHADDDFGDDERKHLLELVQTQYGIPRDEADELIELADRSRRTPLGVGRFAALIAERFSDQEKRALLEEVWRLVLADGVLAQREVVFLEELAKLLHLDPEELAAARRAAEGTAPHGTN